MGSQASKATLVTDGFLDASALLPWFNLMVQDGFVPVDHTVFSTLASGATDQELTNIN